MYGFERIPAQSPGGARASCAAFPERRRSLHDLRSRLAAADYQEVVNFSFVEAEWEADFAGNTQPIRLLNPIASQMAVMRSSLIGGLVANVRYNLNRKLDRVRVFEIGRAFLRDPGMPGMAIWMWPGFASRCGLRRWLMARSDEEQWGVPGAHRSISSTSERSGEPVRAAGAFRVSNRIRPCIRDAARGVLLDGVEIGWIGELHPRWQQKYELPGPLVLFEVDAEPLRALDLPVTGRSRNFRLCAAIWPLPWTKKSRSRPCWMALCGHETGA